MKSLLISITNTTQAIIEMATMQAISRYSKDPPVCRFGFLLSGIPIGFLLSGMPTGLFSVGCRRSPSFSSPNHQIKFS
jgi:hypothetical protein